MNQKPKGVRVNISPDQNKFIEKMQMEIKEKTGKKPSKEDVIVEMFKVGELMVTLKEEAQDMEGAEGLGYVQKMLKTVQNDDKIVQKFDVFVQFLKEYEQLKKALLKYDYEIVSLELEQKKLKKLQNECELRQEGLNIGENKLANDKLRFIDEREAHFNKVNMFDAMKVKVDDLTKSNDNYKLEIKEMNKEFRERLTKPINKNGVFDYILPLLPVVATLISTILISNKMDKNAKATIDNNLELLNSKFKKLPEKQKDEIMAFVKPFIE